MMNAEKVMTLIVRGAGLVCLVLAWRYLFDLVRFLWQERTLTGAGDSMVHALLRIGFLGLIGLLLWIFSRRIGPWLCMGPRARKPTPGNEGPGPLEEDTRE